MNNTKATKEVLLETMDLILKENEDVQICSITPEIVTRTIKCFKNNPVRAIGALHLGSAFIVEPD